MQLTLSTDPYFTFKNILTAFKNLIFSELYLIEAEVMPILFRGKSRYQLVEVNPPILIYF